MGDRICTNPNCSQINPQSITAFSVDNRAKSKLQSRCKTCRSIFNKEVEHNQVAKTQSKEWRKTHPKEIKAFKYQKYWPNLTYEQSLLEYDKLMLRQNNLCAICGKPETVRHQQGTLRNLAIDHCHATGKVRGLLCSRCNLGLGMFKDEVALLEKTIDYLVNS
jgi:hypothetical protein